MGKTKAELKSELASTRAKLDAEERLTSRLKQRIASFEAADADEGPKGTVADAHFELSKCGINAGNLACRIGLLIRERDRARHEAKVAARKQEQTKCPPQNLLPGGGWKLVPGQAVESSDYLRGRLEATERAHDALLKRLVGSGLEEARHENG